MLALLLCLFSILLQAATEPLHYGLFGDLHVARPAQPIARTVIFLSDADGWDSREEAYAQALAEDAALVVGVDLPSYLKALAALKDHCSYPAAHLEEVSHWIERHEALADYFVPTLIGLERGANLAYAIAAQAPAGTFRDLVTLGADFSLRWEKPFCPGDAGPVTAQSAPNDYAFVPVAQLPLPWLADPFAFGTRRLGMPAPLERLIGLGRESPMKYSGAANELAANLREAHRYADARKAKLPEDVADLPITDIEPIAPVQPRIAIVLTGDGGWAGLDKGVAAALAARGMRVVGFSTLKFFWQTRKPEEAADAVARIIGHYSAQVPDAKFILIGYSFGASLAPVVANRLPDAARERLIAQYLISPDDDAVFEIKVGDWFGSAHHDGTLPIAPELAITKVPAFCIHGADESDTPCRTLDGHGVSALSLPGGHHYDGDYSALGTLIFEHLPAAQ
ncbi:MAG: AcvB/VirJ family lysyl-phosphatidylglycerol hydrolase [Tahibacter sp.]